MTCVREKDKRAIDRRSDTEEKYGGETEGESQKRAGGEEKKAEKRSERDGMEETAGKR